jgi:Ca-activated chloride channel family protein
MRPFQFSHPSYLLLLLLVPGFYLLMEWRWRARRRDISPAQRSAFVIRALILTLLTLTLSGLRIPLKGPGIALVFVLDHSDSITSDSRTAALNYINRVATAMQQGHKIGLIVFGNEAVIEYALGDNLNPLRIESVPLGTRTHIARALALALSMLTSQHGKKRIILLSDGHQNAGNAKQAAAMAAAYSIPIDVLPLAALPTPHSQAVRVTQTVAPLQVHLGEPFYVKTTLSGPQHTPVTLKLYRNGAYVIEQRLTLSQRDRDVYRFSQRLDVAGFHHFQVILNSAADVLRQPTSSGSVVYASGKPRLLFLTSTPHPTVLRDILVRHGWDVKLAEPADMPVSAAGLSRYDLIIFDNIESARVTAQQMQSIADYVEQYGGGFMMTGGTKSFGPGGYAQTALARILPITMHPKIRHQQPSLAAVLVIDKSGSMATKQASRTKFDRVKQAVQTLLDVLNPDDAIGIIAFDDRARTIVPLRQLSQQSDLDQRLQTIQASGRTAIYPALAQAYEWLRDLQTPRKHILLLSDGQTAPADFTSLLHNLTRAGIIVSVVGIGNDMNRSFLQRLAAMGQGRIYFPAMINDLPQIFAREARLIAGNWLRLRRFQPQVKQQHTIFRQIDIDTIPELDGYIASSAKPNAAELIVSDIGEPILATWQFGLGRTLVLTSDLSSAWASRWLSWTMFDRLWTHMVRWTSRAGTDHTLHPDVTVDGDMVRVTIDALEKDGHFINFLEMAAAIRMPSGEQQKLVLPQIALGRYAVQFRATKRGAYLFHVTALSKQDGREHTANFGIDVSLTSELSALGTNMSLLRDITRITGGRLLSNNDRPVDTDTSTVTYADIRQLLVLAALFLFFFEVALRRRDRSHPR